MVNTPPGRVAEIASRFAARSRALATDGFIVYDIQDEPGRDDDDTPRPFPFRRLMDSSPYAALLARTSGKPCVVYKCVADPEFDDWLEAARHQHGHTAVNLVGRASSDGDYQGPTLAEAMEKAKPRMAFGCVCIAERHTMESARARGRDYPTEHRNMIRKQAAGAGWFISQAVYDAEPTIRLLKDYAAACRLEGLPPRKVLLTFAPVSRPKTMGFLKWLGVRVPPAVEDAILRPPDEKVTPIEASLRILCGHLDTILKECGGLGIPLGISCESVSIYKAEIDGVHELFRRLQSILMDHRKSPWKVQWVEVAMPPANQEGDDDEDPPSALAGPASAALLGALTGGALVATGFLLGRGGPGARRV